MTGGVGAPAYLNVPGFDKCLLNYTPAGASHSQKCLPSKKPYDCNQHSWDQSQNENVFQGDCPIGFNSAIGMKSVQAFVVLSIF